MSPKTENASKAAGFTVLLVTQRRTVNASSEAFSYLWFFSHTLHGVT